MYFTQFNQFNQFNPFNLPIPTAIGTIGINQFSKSNV